MSYLQLIETVNDGAFLRKLGNRSLWLNLNGIYKNTLSAIAYGDELEARIYAETCAKCAHLLMERFPDVSIDELIVYLELLI